MLLGRCFMDEWRFARRQGKSKRQREAYIQQEKKGREERRRQNFDVCAVFSFVTRREAEEWVEWVACEV